MIKPLSILFICLASCLFFNNSQAQQSGPPLVSDARRAELNALSQQYDQTYQSQKIKYLDLSKRHNWLLRGQRKDGGVTSLHGIRNSGMPIFVRTDNNVTSAATTRTNYVQPGGALGLNLSGSSTFLNGKLAIWDGGAPLATHQEFAGKTITIHDTALGTIDHATHVTGTMIAKGINPPVKGMSFGANTLISYDFDNDVAEMSSQAANLLLSNHSYGTIAGWDFDETNNRWDWYGLPGDSVDYNFGFYDSQSQAWDKIAYTAPNYLIVESAGNSRGYPGPALGEDYYGFKSRTDFTFVDKGPRPATISSNTYYDVIPDYANAKNILTVGAVNPIPNGPTNRGDVAIAFFSSWGPTDDGRIKPDICGMGVNVLSTIATSTTAYGTESGTSMSAPNVTGSLYLLQEYWAKINGGAFMRSATLKGLACGTAFDAGNVGPDYIYGWGLLDMQKAAQAITDNGVKSIVRENTLNTGQTQTFNVVASGNGPLVATIAWTDPAATPTTDGTINSRTPKLINDLDIRISDGTTTSLPWVLNPDQPATAATLGDNIRDNVEQVNIANPVPGKAYTITVSHKGTLQSGSQAYSLIAIGVGGSVYCASAPTSNADSRIDNFSLNNVTSPTPTACTTYTDYSASTAIQLEPGKTYPLTLTLGTCGANFSKAAKVFVDWNANGAFEASELVATTPVTTATATFTLNITVPTNVTVGNVTRLRVVLVETTDPATIAACGSYAKGETQDYRVQFIQPAVDAGATVITGTTPSGLCAGKTNFTVSLKNYGTATLTSVPFTVTIQAANGAVTTFNETYPGSLAAGAQVDFQLANTFVTSAGATYSITATTNVTGDFITADNQATATLVIAATPVPTNTSAYYCINTKNYLLTASAGPTDGLLWYQTATATTPVTSGSPATTTTAPTNNIFYLGVNDLSGTVGPATKNVFTGGGYNQFSPTVTVNTKVPVVLQSARLYVGNSGRVTFTASDSTGQIVSSTALDLVATRTTPVTGAAPDDPNDPGQVYNLNLILPKAGTYTISANFEGNSSLYRSNLGVTGYPFSIGNVFSITGNSATPNSTSYYYYFYNLQVISYGCTSGARVPVTLTTPVVTRTGNVLSSNFTTGNQWYFNGTLIPGATGQTYSPVEAGNYQVSVVVNANGCTAISANFAFALIALHPDNSDIGLALFPIPVSSKLNVVFTAVTGGDLVMQLINSAGQISHQEQRTVSAGPYSTQLNVSNLAPGVYVLRLTLAGKKYTKKVIIVHS